MIKITISIIPVFSKIIKKKPEEAVNFLIISENAETI